MAIDPSATYPGQVDSSDPAGWPHSRARNESSPGARDGWPLEQTWIRDLQGWQQALLDAAGLTPSNDPDKVGASQYLQAIQTLDTNALAESDRRRRIQAQINWAPRDAAGGFSTAFTGAAWSGEATVIVGDSGEIQSSPDGIRWSGHAAAGSYSGIFEDVAFSSSLDLFVAVGGSGEIQTAPASGSPWTQQTPAGSPGTIGGVAWSPDLELFVAVGQTGYIATSPDGVTWTERTAAGGFSSSFHAVARSPDLSLFVAVGSFGEIQSSPDGINWTQRSADGSPDGFRGVAWGDGVFVIVGDSGEIQSSPDGINWTQRFAADGYTSDFLGVGWTGDMFITVGVDGGSRSGTQMSFDGVSWAQIDNHGQTMRAVATLDFPGGSRRLVQVGANGQILASLRSL